MSTTVRLPDELVAEIDRLRGLVPREAWIRDQLQRLVAILLREYP